MSIKLADLQTTTKYQEMDDDGRLKFQGFCIGNPWCKFERKSKDEYSPWDVSYYSGNTLCIGEIKDRKETYDRYEDWMLEIKKLISLKEVRTKTLARNPNINVVIHYINITEDDEIMIWDITNLTEESSLSMLLPTTTAEDNGTKEKDVTFLNNKLTIINTKTRI